MGADQVLMVYITASNREEAERLADAMVEARVAACVNILGAIRSVYRWSGKVERGDEVVMIAKTTRDVYPQLEQLVRERHSYECPCIVAVPVENGHAEFLAWVKRQVG